MEGDDVKKRALLVIYNAAHFRELLRLAQLLLKSGAYVPVLLFVSPYPGLSTHYQQCVSLGVRAIVRGQSLQKKTHRWLVTIALIPSAFYNVAWLLVRATVPGFLRKPLRSVYQYLARRCRRIGDAIKELLYSTINHLLGLIKSSDNLWVHGLRAVKEWRFARRICRILQPDIVILAEDNVEYLSGVWVRAAHQQGLPVLVVPYCLAGIEEPAAVYWKHPKHDADSDENQRLARSFPQWVYEYQGRRLVRLPAKRALPMEWLDISSPLPWVMNGSYADAIAVESEFMRNFYKRQGIPAKQLVTTGAVSDDVLYATLQDLEGQRYRLYRQYGMQEDRPMLLCALPPFTSAMANLRQEFESYDDMIRFWIDSMKRVEGYNVFISLHPTMDRTQFKWIEEIGWWGMGLAPPDTAVMIALCDIYVASVSSTIRWAIACGKPVINYDVYRFRFPDFRPAPGVITVETKEEFLLALRRITTDSNYYDLLREAQLNVSGYWGMIDGRSGKRILELIDRLTQQYTTKPKYYHGMRGVEASRIRKIISGNKLASCQLRS
jgi:hypothetical protein